MDVVVVVISEVPVVEFWSSVVRWLLPLCPGEDAPCGTSAMGITFVDCVLAEVVMIELPSAKGLEEYEPRWLRERLPSGESSEYRTCACGSRLIVELLMTGYMRTWSAEALLPPSRGLGGFSLGSGRERTASARAGTSGLGSKVDGWVPAAAFSAR